MIDVRPALRWYSISLAYRLHTMDEESADIPGAECAPVPEVLPGTAARERATLQGDGLDPTRYGDWEMNGRCIDF